MEILSAFFERYRLLAMNTYSVDPLVFFVIYFGVTPLYYYGEYLMLKAAIKHYRERHNSAEPAKLIDLSSEKGFIAGLLINRLSWLAPYIYVLVYGENLSWWLYVMIFSWMIFICSIFLIKSHSIARLDLALRRA